MNRRAEFEAAYAAALERPALPPRITLAYETDTLLSEGETREVWRLRRRCDGAPFILKLDWGWGELEEEFRLLVLARRVLQDRVPLPVDCFEENEIRYLLRSCLPGETLEQYRTRTGGCSEEICIRLGAELCTLLEGLHGLEPPLIHRDIKPENLVLGEDGRLGIIDFGIARCYAREKENDTRCMGTEATAAPEQYGFAQTDGRTDLYALGCTLIWLLTGSYERDSLEHAPVSRRLRRVLLRCTSFAPEERYQTAGTLRDALLGRRPLRKKVLAAGTCTALLCAALLGRAGWNSRPVSFPSAGLEAAVRQELAQPEGNITYADLERVERLALVGENAFPREAEYSYLWGTSCLDGAVRQEEPRGSLSDLSLLSDMPNLKELYLCRQSIADLTPLSGLPLEVLALSENQISDLLPLSSLTGLKQLWLADNPVACLSPLAGLEQLQMLNLDKTPAQGGVDSLSPLTELPLEVLSLCNVHTEDGDWSFLRRLPRLRELTLQGPPQAAVEALAAREDLLPVLTLYDFTAPDLTALSGCRVQDLRIAAGLESLAGVEALPCLRNLGLFSCNIASLSPLEGALDLETVSFNGLLVEDFSPLNRLPRLHAVVGDRTEAVERDCPGRRFSVLPLS